MENERTKKKKGQIKKLHIFIVSALLLMLFLTPTILFAASYCFNQILARAPLLLNSKLTPAELATVKYILWKEDDGELAALETYLQDSGLEWEKETLRDFAGSKAVKYTAQICISQEKEYQALDFYHNLNLQAKRFKAQAYFAEWINFAVDPANMCLKLGITPHFWVKTPGLVSWSGYHPALPGAIIADGKRINYQLLTTNGSRTVEKTVLAVPALLEDF